MLLIDNNVKYEKNNNNLKIQENLKKSKFTLNYEMPSKNFL